MNKVLSVIIGFTCVFFVTLAVVIIYGLYQTGVKIKQQEQLAQQKQQREQFIVDHQCVQKQEALMTGYANPKAQIDAYNAECGSLLPLQKGILEEGIK